MSDDTPRRMQFNKDDVRLATTCVGGGLLLAVMTGPAGNPDSPSRRPDFRSLPVTCGVFSPSASCWRPSVSFAARFETVNGSRRALCLVARLRNSSEISSVP